MLRGNHTVTPNIFASYITSARVAAQAERFRIPASGQIWRQNKHRCCVSSPGKAFEITYIRLKFYTSRPESFAIYKRTEQDGPWLPYQYYSSTCRKTYGNDLKTFIRPGDDEQTALCTDEFSDISPLTGGNVAFSTLEGRPSAYNYDQSLVLQVRAGPCSRSALCMTLRFQKRESLHINRNSEICLCSCTGFHKKSGSFLAVMKAGSRCC